MPPGIRPPDARTGLVERRAPYGAAWIERVETRGDAEAGPPGRAADGDRGAGAEPGAASRAVSVEYTVDPELDARVRDILARGGVSLGHVVLMDPASGEVFSYVSTDPVRFPATRAYPMASLMKVVTAAAVLRNAPEAAQRRCRYVGSPWELPPGYLHPPATGGRVQSFTRALAVSNNQCFARLAVHDVGEAPLLDELARVGLLDAPAPGHAAGRIGLSRGAFHLGHLASGLSGSFVTPWARPVWPRRWPTARRWSPPGWPGPGTTQARHSRSHRALRRTGCGRRSWRRRCAKP